MRVLFYEDPLTERHNWAWRVGHIWYDAVTLRRLREQGVACRMVVNELGRDEAVARGCDEADLVVVPEAELRAVLPDPQERVNYLFHDRFFYDLHRTDGPRERARLWWRLLGGDRAHALMRRYALDVHDRLRDFYRARLGGFVPDVVTAWCPVPFLRTLFPRAEALVKEAGFFGATPFPWSHYYDPCGFHAHSWPRRHFARAARPTPPPSPPSPGCGRSSSR